jgi:RHS repeat-associated protein
LTVLGAWVVCWRFNDTVNGLHFTAYDGNGNVVALLKASDGTLSATYEYGPFGELIRASGPMARLNPIRFSTKYTDDESDLVYYGFRYYNQSTGRWLGHDPIEERGGRNLFSFANNRPLTHIDRDGRDILVLPPAEPVSPVHRPPSNPTPDQKPRFRPPPSTPGSNPFKRRCCPTGALGIGAGILFTPYALNGGEEEMQQLRLDFARLLQKATCDDRDECHAVCERLELTGDELNACYCLCEIQYPATPRRKSPEELRKLRIEVRNRSQTKLPYLSIGVLAPNKLKGGVRLDVSDLEPGQSKVLEVDCYLKQARPEDVQLFAKPLPAPEDRDYRWEFRQLPGKED